MGRRKITIEPIVGDRNRSATYIKRKTGLFKKAYELAVLTDSEVAVIVFGRNGKLAEFCSGDIDQFLMRYTEYSGTVEKKGPEHFMQANNVPRPPIIRSHQCTESSWESVAESSKLDSIRVPDVSTRRPGQFEDIVPRSTASSWNVPREHLSANTSLDNSQSDAQPRRWSAPIATESGSLPNNLMHETGRPDPPQPPTLKVEIPPQHPSPGNVPLQSTPGSISLQPVSPISMPASSPFVPLSPMSIGAQPTNADDVSVDASLACQHRRSTSVSSLHSPMQLSVPGESFNAINYDDMQPGRLSQPPPSPIPLYQNTFAMAQPTVNTEATMNERLMPPPDFMVQVDQAHSAPATPVSRSPLSDTVSVRSQGQPGDVTQVVIPNVDAQVPIPPRGFVP